ncbi:hypothetical protein POM88_034743 [Heracleum sosnowskyi]|uniref:Uncharacterized protein n=1 Tax=Heracleum sosnowskyi TaxID=360622 RepID=A0AAD8HL53_9APIA|nr:hypothetical protein POM88_034743 [Heracleum sosnowskyi]
MANKNSTILLSSSGKVEYAITNHVAFLEKDSVHEDFHSLMDFLKNSPVSYALTASPTIYAEIVQDMWSSACCSQAKIKLKIRVTKNPHGEVEFVLPRHIQVQVSALYSSPSQVPLPSQSQSGKRASSLVSQNGKRKKTYLPTITTYYKSITVEGDEENETSAEVHAPRKKMDASVVKLAKKLFNVDHEPPLETRDGVPVVDITSSEKENPKCDLPPLKPNSREEVLPDDRQHLVNAASVLKSQLVARLTSSAEKLRTEDMNDLADRCYNALRELGEDYTSFRRDVYRLIAQHQKLEYAAKNKDNWNDRDIKARYNQKVFSLSNMTTKLSSAEDKLSRAETKREELKTALLRLTEELSEEEDRIKTLTAERNKCKEAHSDIEVQFEKLVAEKKKVSRELTRCVYGFVLLPVVLFGVSVGSPARDQASGPAICISSEMALPSASTFLMLRITLKKVLWVTTEEEERVEAHCDVEVEFEELVAEEAFMAFEAINACYNTAKKEFERMKITYYPETSGKTLNLSDTPFLCHRNLSLLEFFPGDQASGVAIVFSSEMALPAASIFLML